MSRSLISQFVTEDHAAIGPLYAIGISVLVVMSAIGFDYGRLMALDSELQNAADQAALAAATQLDGGDDAMTRARSAATNAFATAGSAFTNQTRFANDRLGRPITDLTFEFFDDYANDTPGTLLTNDADGADAKVVQVTVNARRVFYALTPLVGAINSGNVIGKAMAGLQSATCNVPPMMFCVPNDASGNAVTNFPTEADIGKGLRLHMNANQADPWAPGNFGFLNIDYDIRGNPNRRLGQNNSASGCINDVVESETGVRDPESTALNTRFDMYPNSGNFACDPSTGDFCPAENTRKSFTFTEVKAIRQRQNLPIPATPACGDYDSRTGWNANPAAVGMPEDNCFISGSCAVFGNTAASSASPNWNASAYMAAHHGSTTLASVAPNGTRYEVYQWELTDAAANLAPRRWSSPPVVSGNGAFRTYTFTNICSYGRPTVATGVPASDTQKDRRVLTVAAVDCTGLNGRDEVKILRWVDLFLVKPANETGSQKEFFTEIIGPARQPNGDSGFQYYGRKKAVLIR
jgi:Flp pilus assembly protein TadG